METVALSFPRLALVPTSEFPRDAIKAIEVRRSRRAPARLNVFKNCVRTTLVWVLTLLCVNTVVLSLILLHLPLWILLLAAGHAFIFGRSVVSLTRDLACSVREFRSLKIPVELRIAAAEEVRMIEAGWSLNNRIIEWNEAARVAEAHPDIDACHVRSLRTEQARLERLREGAMACILNPPKPT